MKISFVGPQRKIIEFEIEGKVVRYFDEMWKKGIQVYPLDDKLIKKMKRTGNKNMQFMAALILDANKGKELEEYESCNTEEDIAEFVRKDCKSKGLVEVK